VAIIGAGAYGLPMASFVKSIGKKAVHLGGVTQILFGIKGKRREKQALKDNLYNRHWVRASQDETPDNSSSIENRLLLVMVSR
jgi:glycerol-3-phosphate dehydrogenase